MSRHYLFTLWDGAGTVPPELSVARALISAATASPCSPTRQSSRRPRRRRRLSAVGEAPHLSSRRPQDDSCATSRSTARRT